MLFSGCNALRVHAVNDLRYLDESHLEQTGFYIKLVYR